MLRSGSVTAALTMLSIAACANAVGNDAGSSNDALSHDAIEATATAGTGLPQMTARHILEPDAGSAIEIDEEIDDAWADAPVTSFDTQWSGAHTKALTHVRILWSERALYMLWEIEESDFFMVDGNRPTDVDQRALFREDCVEVFLAPDPTEHRRYFEIELGAKGHFFDLKIDKIKNKSDESFSSKAEIKGHINREARTGRIEVALRAPEILAALKPNAQLPMNLFRMEGKAPAPHLFLAWSPTKTPTPNFHVPEKFGSLLLAP